MPACHSYLPAVHKLTPYRFKVVMKTDRPTKTGHPVVSVQALPSKIMGIKSHLSSESCMRPITVALSDCSSRTLSLLAGFSCPPLVKPAASQWSLWIKQNIFFFCAKGDVIKVNKAFRGRITLPGYAASPLNGTMEISSLRTNDSGTYRCQIVMDNLYERDSVPLVVSGKSSNGSTSWEKPTGSVQKRRPSSRDSTFKWLIFFFVVALFHSRLVVLIWHR